MLYRSHPDSEAPPVAGVVIVHGTVDPPGNVEVHDPSAYEAQTIVGAGGAADATVNAAVGSVSEDHGPVNVPSVPRDRT
jgi:FtsP/CotA-like multicopper oxidase with cupredoxin domain